MILEINKDSVFKSKLEDVNKFDKSFFKECYIKAYNSINDILNQSSKDEDDFNNIIAFVGDRGSGKTSTMKSFKESINTGKQGIELDYDIFKREYYNGDVKVEYSVKYDVLDIIDPSFFSQKESIVEIVVAKMFKNFKENQKKDSIFEKQELVKRFERVQKDLTRINMNKQEMMQQSNDNLENIMSLASVVDLRISIKELVDKYLKYSNEVEENNKNMLVISIDDLDMNLTVGERMLEDIRKYLMQDNIIILMATKFEQLEEVVSQKFIVGLKDNYEFYDKFDGELLRNFKNDIDEMVERYLNKIIPYNRRCFMPKIDIINTKVKCDKLYFKTLLYKDNKEDEYVNELICRNLIKKMNLIIATQECLKSIVPENLREFIEFLIILNNMESADELKNIRSFKTYIYNNIKNQINDSDKSFILDILNCNLLDMKKKVIIYLNTKLCKVKEVIDGSYMSSISESIKFVDDNKRTIKTKRITFGDLITWINYYETVFYEVEHIVFINLLKNLVSIRLLEAYNDSNFNLLNFTGVDLFGDIFILKGNDRSGMLNFNISLKSINSVNSRKQLLEKFKGNIESENSRALLPILIQPAFNKDNAYERLVRREFKSYYKINEIDDFMHFKFNIANIIGYIIFREDIELIQTSDSKNGYEGVNQFEIARLRDVKSIENSDKSMILYMINIDFWNEIINYIDIKLINERDKVEIAKRFKKIFLESIKRYSRDYEVVDYINVLDHDEKIIDELINVTDKLVKRGYDINKEIELENRKHLRGKMIQDINDLTVKLNSRIRYLNEDRRKGKLLSKEGINAISKTFDEIDILLKIHNEIEIFSIIDKEILRENRKYFINRLKNGKYLFGDSIFYEIGAYLEMIISQFEDIKWELKE